MSSQRAPRPKRNIPSTAPTSSVGTRATRSQSVEDAANRPRERNVRRSTRASSTDVLETVEKGRAKKVRRPNALQQQQQQGALVTLSEEPVSERLDVYQAESPRRTSNISGTTARTSNSAQDLDDLNSEDILDNLPDLYEASSNILDLCCPIKASQADIKSLLQSLGHSSSRPRKNLEKSKRKLRAALSAYTADNYINVSLVLRSLLRPKELEGLEDGLWRPDDLFHQTNLASTIEELISYDPNSRAQGSLLQKLDRDFPERFLESFRGPSEVAVTGSSILLAQSFEIGLELRTQFTLQVLTTYSSNPSFDANEMIRQSFGEPHSSDTRGWHVEGLHFNQLSENQKQAVQARCQAIGAYFHNESISTALDRLRAQFPYSRFVLRFIEWTSARKSEIINSLENHDMGQGIGLGIQEALESEIIQKRPSIAGDGDLPPAIEIKFQPPPDMPLSESSAHLSSKVSSPAASHLHKYNSPSLINHLFTRKTQARSSSSVNRNAHRSSAGTTVVKVASGPTAQISLSKSPLISAAASNPSPLQSTVPAESPSSPSTNQPPRASEPVGETPNSSDFDAGLSPFDLDDENDQTTLGHYIPGFSAKQGREKSQSVPSTQIPSAKQRAEMIEAQRKVEAEQNKENDPSIASQSHLRRGKIFERQSGAVRLEFDSQPEEEVIRASSEDQQPREILRSSQDEDFQLDPRPPNANRTSQRKRKAPASTAAPTSKRSKVIVEDTRSSTTPSPSPPRPRRTPQGGAPSMSQMYRTFNQQAKAITIQFNTTKPIQTRRPWSEEEIESLIGLIEENGTSWARLKKIDIQEGGVLAGRDQVALKDKARNMKVDYLKSNKPLPTNFEFIPLNQKQKESLRDIGIDYE